MDSHEKTNLGQFLEASVARFPDRPYLGTRTLPGPRYQARVEA
jgi:hypothetical protein